MKNRIFEMENGHLLITSFAEKARLNKETDQQLMDRQTQKLKYKNLSYYDMDVSEIPERKNRNKWRMNPNKTGIIVDDTLETIQEAIETEINKLDAELAKPMPDPAVIIKNQRNVDKLKTEKWLTRKKK